MMLTSADLNELDPSVDLDQVLSASTEGLTDMSSILAMKQAFVTAMEESPKKEKTPVHLYQGQDSEFDLLIDDDLLWHLLYPESDVNQLIYKKMMKLRPGTVVNINTQLSSKLRYYFIFLSLIAFLNLMKARGIRLIFKFNNTNSYMDAFIMSMCHDIKIYDFAFLTLGTSIDLTDIGDSLKNTYTSLRDDVFAFLVSKNLLTEDEKQSLIDSPNENTILLTAEQMRRRLVN